MTSSNDFDLLARIGRGDRSAFADLYQRYAPVVFGYARRILKDKARAEDVMQDVWIKLVQAAPGFRGQASVRSWLMTITRNTALNELRRKDWNSDEWNEGENETAPLGREEFEQELLNRFRIELVKQALDELPESQRVALVLWLTEDFSYEQLASQMDLSIPAVKSLLFRARRTLEIRLKEPA